MDNSRDYYRGGFPGQYATRRLFRWSDGEYNCQYWQRLERNWKQWKNVKLVGGVKTPNCYSAEFRVESEAISILS